MFFPVQIHPSASPAHQRAILHESLKTRVVHPRLHYESAEQTRKWLLLHRQYSPAVAAEDGGFILRQAFAQIAGQAGTSHLQVISLGCGGGNKDALLLRRLRKEGIALHYVPCDISLGLVLEAAALAKKEVPPIRITPVLCDLTGAADISVLLNSKSLRSCPRVFLFLGMLPSMDQKKAHLCLLKLLAKNDYLLVSANLLPGASPEEGLKRILPQYDNSETREWLLVFLRDLGVPVHAGEIRFKTFTKTNRIEAVFQFRRHVRISVDDKAYSFEKGGQLSLFFSNRHTLSDVRNFLDKLTVRQSGEWISATGEEGLFSGVATGCACP